MSYLENDLANYLEKFGIPFEAQYRFIQGRRYLADFAIPRCKLIIEVQGGIHMKKSGHNTGSGLTRDYKKANLAQLHGWTYLQFTAEDIHSGAAIQMITDFISKANNDRMWEGA